LTGKYSTKLNDTFDLIAYEIFGDCKYTADLLKANPDKLQTFIFSAGENLNVPEIEVKAATSNLPSWY